MTSASRRAVPLPHVVLVVLLGSCFPHAAAQDAAQSARELELLRERIGALRQTLDRDLARQDRARSELRESEQTVARQTATLREVSARLQASQRRLETLRGRRAERERELQAERGALAGQLRAAYALGRQERLKLLLNQEDPAAVGRVLVYHGYLNRSRIERIERVEALLEELARLEDGIAEETTRLADERERERATLAALERTREARAAAIAAIEREVRDQGRRLERMEADEQALLRLLESLANVLADIPADVTGAQRLDALRGRLAWPTRGQVARGFGQAREGGTRLRGVLIAAPAGSDVRAVAHGRVAWAGWMPHYGNLVVIEHGDDFYTLYGHNQALLREAGDWVAAGDVIAQVGDSGGQAQSALYFELRKGRTPLNPQQWLVAR